MQYAVIPVFLFLASAGLLAVGLLTVSKFLNPDRVGRVKQMPYESGMDPVHDTRRRFDVRFYLLAIAFLVFDVELLFLYPWAVASHPVASASADTATSLPTPDAAPNAARQTNLASHPGHENGPSPSIAANGMKGRHTVFFGAMVFIALLTLGYIYDWRKGVFQWR